MKTKNNIMMVIPLGNSKEEYKTREEIISLVYRRWIEENPDKRVYNRSLKDYINIRYLSITETMRHAAKSYTSTLALLQLDTILRYAVKTGKPKPTKRGSNNQKDFAQIQIMHYDLVGIGTVMMIVGIKRSGEKIQYCITAIKA